MNPGQTGVTQPASWVLVCVTTAEKPLPLLSVCMCVCGSEMPAFQFSLLQPRLQSGVCCLAVGDTAFVSSPQLILHQRGGFGLMACRGLESCIHILSTVSRCQLSLSRACLYNMQKWATIFHGMFYTLIIGMEILLLPTPHREVWCFLFSLKPSFISEFCGVKPAK